MPLFLVYTKSLPVLLRGTIVNRTYGTHKNLYIYLFFTNNIWSYLLWSPAIVVWDYGDGHTRKNLQQQQQQQQQGSMCSTASGTSTVALMGTDPRATLVRLLYCICLQLDPLPPPTSSPAPQRPISRLRCVCGVVWFDVASPRPRPSRQRASGQNRDGGALGSGRGSGTGKSRGRYYILYCTG